VEEGLVSKKSKNDVIQVLRAVAALLVVYAHSIDLIERYAVPRQIHFFYLENFGACGVDIFFCISGFILSNAILRTAPELRPSGFGFMLRRYLRIFPLYWIMTTIFVILYGSWRTDRTIDSYFLLPSLHSSIQEPYLQLGWTLIFEMFFYYTLAFNLWIGKRWSVERTILSIFGCIAVGSIFGFQHRILILFANPINIEFALGGCIALAFARIGPRPFVGKVLTLLGGLLLSATIVVGYGAISEYEFTLNGSLAWSRVMRWGIAAAILTAGLVFNSHIVRSAFGRFWVFLGDASYSIYLSSLISLRHMGSSYDRHFPFRAHPDLGVFLTLAIATAIGCFFYLLLERPITRYLTRMLHTPAVQSAP
jgi:exopolysaccharide production protein ExoZ